MKNYFLTVLFLMVTGIIQAQEVAPKLEYVFEIQAVCDPAYDCGQTPTGQVRNIIPITGGKVVGPKLQGKVIPGGADYQLVDKESGRTQLEAIYSIQTHDGVNIHVRNVGILVPEKDGVYFRTAPKFEAPMDSPYAWLNNSLFICVPGPGDGYISLKMWKVD